MRSFLHGLLLAAPFVTGGFANENHGPDADTIPVARTTFERLLDQVSPPALHHALHIFNPGRYRHGSFEDDRQAAEAVHQDDPEYATNMIVMAKRQADNTTTPTEVPSDIPTDTPTEQTSEEIPVPVSTEVVTATPDQSTVVVIQSSTLPQPTPVATTPESESLPAAPIPSTTPSAVASIPAVSSVVVPVSSTTPAEETVTSAPASESGDDNTSGVEETTSRQRTRVSSVVVMTTTLGDGSISTVTAITVVPGEAAPTADSAGSETEPSGALQSEGAAPRSIAFGWKAVGVIGGAVGVALAL